MTISIFRKNLIEGKEKERIQNAGTSIGLFINGLPTVEEPVVFFAVSSVRGL
jgi:hypothetical protein